MTRLIASLSRFLTEFADIMEHARTGRPPAGRGRHGPNDSGGDACTASMTHMNMAHGSREHR
jgi:hypothetical protein